MTKPLDFRFVEVRNTVYLRKEDVVAYLRSLAETEETDVRRRIEAAAEALKSIALPGA